LRFINVKRNIPSGGSTLKIIQECLDTPHSRGWGAASG